MQQPATEAETVVAAVAVEAAEAAAKAAAKAAEAEAVAAAEAVEAAEAAADAKLQDGCNDFSIRRRESYLARATSCTCSWQGTSLCWGGTPQHSFDRKVKDFS